MALAGVELEALVFEKKKKKKKLNKNIQFWGNLNLKSTFYCLWFRRYSDFDVFLHIWRCC